MKNFLLKNKNQKGYALLFAVLVISSISVVTAGLISTVYKQLILSMLARDSSSAFYQADTAVDCAMYTDLYASSLDSWNDATTITCGGFDLNIKKKDGGSYDLLPPEDVLSSNDPCFKISVYRIAAESADSFNTDRIEAKGYNVCNTSNSRIVEREIVVNFKE